MRWELSTGGLCTEGVCMEWVILNFMIPPTRVRRLVGRLTADSRVTNALIIGFPGVDPRDTPGIKEGISRLWRVYFPCGVGALYTFGKKRLTPGDAPAGFVWSWSAVFRAHMASSCDFSCIWYSNATRTRVFRLLVLNLCIVYQTQSAKGTVYSGFLCPGGRGICHAFQPHTPGL